MATKEEHSKQFITCLGLRRLGISLVACSSIEWNDRMSSLAVHTTNHFIDIIVITDI